MILLCEGVPGSGKSYWGVWKKLLPALRSGRRIYVYIDGANIEKWALFLGQNEDELRKRITVWQTAEEVKAGLLDVEPKSLVFLDECQTIFRAGSKPAPELLRWFEIHRHIGCDVVLLCQAHAQVTSGLIRLVESTIKFQKLWAVGLENRAQGFVRAHPDDLVDIRQFTFKYKPEVYSWYSSYNGAEIEETARGSSVFKAGSVLVAIVAAVFGGGMLLTHSWSFGGEKGKETAAKVSGKKDGITDVLSKPFGAVGALAESSTVRLCVTGTMVNGKKKTYLLADGRGLSIDELAAESGYPVYEKKERDGFVRPFGEGITYGRGCNKNDG